MYIPAGIGLIVVSGPLWYTGTIMDAVQEQVLDLTFGNFQGKVMSRWNTGPMLAFLESLPGKIRSEEAEIVTDGRNLNVRMRTELGGEGLDILVKAFGRETGLQDWLRRRSGSKAERTWTASEYLSRRGVGTPQPIAFFQERKGCRILQSYFVSVYQANTVSVTEALCRLFREDPDCGRILSLMQVLADAVRCMHEAGFVHCDLGNQNVLLSRDSDGQWREVSFIDLNRGRMPAAVSMRSRARDISRIYFPSDLLRVFHEMYWKDVPPADYLYWERHYRRRFAWHTRTRPLRHPLRTFRRALQGSPDGLYPSERDMWIWDEKSAQAVSALRSGDRGRYYGMSRTLSPALSTLRHAIPVLLDFRRRKTLSFGSPVPLAGRIGMAIEPDPNSVERQLRLLEELGLKSCLIRFYHHKGEADRTFRAGVVRQLADTGFSVAIAIVQDRNAVLQPESWSNFVARTLEDCAPYVSMVEAGHAINRVKWGIWGLRDWDILMRPFQEGLSKMPGLQLTGPAVIDFEYPYVLGALARLPSSFRFAALSHHLYVDRRGAPEARQGVFSTVEKCALARSMAAVMRGSDDRLIVSEVNWPLAGTGEYSPVTSPYESPGPRENDPNVSEDDYADFMIRYLLIALCSGHVERVYWWRLVARGFGLVDDTDPDGWRKRPAFEMLRHFVATLGNATFVQRDRGEANGRHVYRFMLPDGECCLVVYAEQGEIPIDPLPAHDRMEDAFGRPFPEACRTLGGRPVYVRGVNDGDDGPPAGRF